MTTKYTCSLRVRSYECDSLGHVNNAVYQQYLEEAAIEAAASVGYDQKWHQARGEAWVLRRMSLEYVRPAAAGDELTITTWISSGSRVRAQRQYLVHRPSDDATIARASGEWVYVDQATGRPRAFPAEMHAAFSPNGETATEPYRLPEQGIEAKTYRWRHQVRRYELDTNQHVNNAVYLNWLEEAKVRASVEAGWPIERMWDEGFAVVQTRHDMEYLQPAVYGDEIEIVSRLYELRRVRGTWLHELYRVGRGDLIARDYCTGAFIATGRGGKSPEGRPVAPPRAFFDDLLRGGAR